MKFLVIVLLCVLIDCCIARQTAFVPLHQRSRSLGPTPARKSPPALSMASRDGGARYDNLVGGLCQISVGASLCVLWSEYSVLATGCGPLQLSDALERFCYQADIVSAGVFWWPRLALQSDMETLLAKDENDWFRGLVLNEFTLLQVKVAEWLAYFTVLGAFVALASQMANGANMDGLSGIDVQQCRTMQEMRSLY